MFDAADVGAVSAFWAAMFDGGVVTEDPRFHCVIDGAGEWIIGVQHAPDHVEPDWPSGAPQQVHLDLHVDDPAAATSRAIELGARPLSTDDAFDADEGHHVFADPAGHPFCIGWGHPSPDQLRRYLDAHPPTPPDQVPSSTAP